MVGDSSSFRLGGCGSGRVADVTYSYPLTDEDRKDLFRQWREANPDLWEAIVRHANWLYKKGHKRISAKYLAEFARYELHYKTVGVPFVDRNGKRHVYGFNNSDTATMARYLLELYPWLPIEVRGK